MLAYNVRICIEVFVFNATVSVRECLGFFDCRGMTITMLLLFILR